MQSGLVKAICQMGVFMICAQAIVHFRPKASYEKYLKLLVSAMMLIQMFLFIGGIFSPEGEKKLAERAEWFADSLEESMRQATENTFFSEDNFQFQITGKDPEGRKSLQDLEEITVQIAPIEPIQVDAVQEMEEMK